MSQPTDFFFYKNGTLSTEGVSLQKIAEQIGTPVYIYSEKAFLSPLRKLKNELHTLHPLICFAMKANSNLSILKLLAENDAGADIVSGGELFLALKAGVPPEKIVFSGVGKTLEEIRIALTTGKYGVRSFNVESLEELELINKTASQLKKTAQICLRFNPDINPKTHPYISTGLKKNKFGMEKSEILKIFKTKSKYKGLNIQGLSIHIGSQLLDLAPIEAAFRQTRNLITEILQKTNYPIRSIDLGGGLGISYDYSPSPSISKYCRLISKYFGPQAKLPHPVQITLEPGRLIAGNAGVLLTQVLYRKKHGKKNFLVIDAAMNDLIRPALYKSHHEILPMLQKHTRGKSEKTSIVGPVCESSDCFASDRPFPQAVKQGDFLVILSAGAYGRSMSSNYNSRLRPPEILIQNRKIRVIRKREKFADLIRHETF